MAIPTLNYPDFRPYTNIQPFTVRDGATYLLILEGLKDWIRDTLVPHIDSEIAKLVESWDSNTQEVIDAMNALSVALIQRVEQAEASIGTAVSEANAAKIAAEAARDLAEIYASQAQEIQDVAVSSIFNDAESALRTATDSVYASIATVDGVITDVAAAQTAADNAQTAADMAQTAANSVQAEVDTIPNVYVKQGIEATQRFMAGMHANTRDMVLMLIGDSTGNERGEWFRRVVDQIADDFPTHTVEYQVTDENGYWTATVDTVQTGTGAFKLRVFNASVAGASSGFWAGKRFKDNVLNNIVKPDLILISIGHNEQGNAGAWYGYYITLTENIAWGIPEADIVCIAQNPATANTLQQQRREVYREIATRRGFGFIDVCQAFLDTGNAPGLTLDGVHPNNDGSILWANTVLSAFDYQGKAQPRTQLASPLFVAGKNLLLNSDFSQQSTPGIPDNWTMSGTMSLDTVNYESFTLAVPATGGGNRTSKARKFYTETSAELRQVVPVPKQGCWVTYGVRARVPAGSPLTVGRLSFTAGGVSINQDSGRFGSDDFHWSFHTVYVPNGSDVVTVRLYINSAASIGEITIDRQFMTLGKMPIAI